MARPTCSVRYEPHLSDKARSSEASRFSITKIWYAYLIISFLRVYDM